MMDIFLRNRCREAHCLFYSVHIDFGCLCFRFSLFSFSPIWVHCFLEDTFVGAKTLFSAINYLLWSDFEKKHSLEMAFFHCYSQNFEYVYAQIYA